MLKQALCLQLRGRYMDVFAAIITNDRKGLTTWWRVAARDADGSEREGRGRLVERERARGQRTGGHVRGHVRSTGTGTLTR